jgi:site-specific DNA recombinase
LLKGNSDAWYNNKEGHAMITERKNIRVLGYGRVSTRKQFLEGTSAKEQKASVKKECKAKGWELKNFVSDDGVSGKTIFDRSAIKKVKKLAQENEFDCLMFTKLDRVGRSLKELNKFWELIEDDLGKQIYCIDYPMISDPKFGELLRANLGWFAEWERNLIFERTRSGQLSSWQDGKSQIGKLPYGYKWSKKKKRIIKDPDEAPIYKKNVSKYVDEHLCFADTANWLTEQGIPTRLGASHWSDSSVGNMLKNPAYKGEPVIYNKYDRKGNEKPKAEWVEVTFPKLISKDRWNQIQERIRLNKKKPKKRHYKAYDRFICNDVLWCGECYSKVKKHLKEESGKYYPYYGCAMKARAQKNLKVKGRERCTLKSVNADMIDEEVWDRVKDLLSHPRSFIKEWLKDPDREEIEEEYTRIKKSCGDLTKEIKRNSKDLFKRKGESRKQMNALLDEADKKLKSEQRKLVELETEMEFYDKKEDKLKEFEKAIESFRNAMVAAPNKIKASKVAAKKTAYWRRLQDEIMRQLDSVPTKDKKRLIEAVVKTEAGGKIIVRYVTGDDLVSDEDWSRYTKEELSRPLYNRERVLCRLEKQISISPRNRTGCL